MKSAKDDNVTQAETDGQAGNEPAVTVRHSSSAHLSRRRFISGSLAVGAMMGSGAALAADCDRNPEQVERCSDGDEGEGADPANCGRCGQESTVPSGLRLTNSLQTYGGQARSPENLPLPGVRVKRVTD